MSRARRQIDWPTWRDYFLSATSIQCPSCSAEAVARHADIIVPKAERAEAEAASRALGISWRIDQPLPRGPRALRDTVTLVRAPDQRRRGRRDLHRADVLVTCSSCGLRTVTPTFDPARQAWFRCWVRGRPLRASNRAHLLAILRYLERTSSPRQRAARDAGPVHKLHGDIMRHRAEAIRRIQQMLAPDWSPGRRSPKPRHP